MGHLFCEEGVSICTWNKLLRVLYLRIGFRRTGDLRKVRLTACYIVAHDHVRPRFVVPQQTSPMRRSDQGGLTGFDEGQPSLKPTFCLTGPISDVEPRCLPNILFGPPGHVTFTCVFSRSGYIYSKSVEHDAV